MLLGIPLSIVEQVEHLGFFILKMVGVHLELPFDQELLALEGRVDSIRKGTWVRLFLGVFRGIVPLDGADGVLLGHLCHS